MAIDYGMNKWKENKLGWRILFALIVYPPMFCLAMGAIFFDWLHNKTIAK
jgi:hypothetical protein